MASRPKRFKYNISELETNNLNLGISSMFSGSFSASNNVSSAIDVTGLSFDNSKTRFFQCQITVTITKSVGSNLYELFTLEGHQTESTWNLYATSLSDITGIQFSITSSGQVQYTSSNISNFVSSTFRFSATQIANTGSYATLNTGTQETYIINSLQINNTVGSIIGTDPGALYVLGGSTFEKMISIRTTEDAVGFGTGGALSIYGGAAISKNLLVNGNLGIGTASPQYELDVNGDMRVSSHIYINGGMSAAAGTSSTFSYLTLTSTDDAINLSTGSLVTYGGITVQSPTDATSVTNGGSFLTDGGASIGKSLFVGGEIKGLNNSNTIGNIYTTGGNVGIGITVPVHTLDVNGGVRSNNFTTTNALITSSSTGTAVATTFTGGSIGLTGAANAVTGTIGTFVATTSSAGTAVATTFTGGSIGLTGAANAVTGTIGTFVATTSSAGTAVATTYTGGSMSLSGNLTIAGTLTTVNITTTNISDTNVSAGTVTATNIGVTTQTVGTARITTSLLALGNSNTIGSIYTTGGNVGIGITNPSDALSVNGNIRLGPTTDSDTDYYIKSAGQLSISANDASSQNSSFTSLLLNCGVSPNQSSINLAGSSVAKYIAISTANTERLRIDASGNVGIGTASPGYKLDVSGTGRFTGKLTITGSVGATGFDTATNDQYADMRVIRNSTSSIDKDMYIQMGAGASSTLRLYSNNTETMVLNGTNVGIGVASPSSKLHVNGNRINIHNAAGTGGGQNLFEGLENANGRAQIVLSSQYSDLVIASSTANNDHGSTLTFASYNPSNKADFRKWVINQGNWGARVHTLEFGYNPNSILNPHEAANDTYTTITLDGSNKRLGINNRSPEYRLDVNGEAIVRGWLRTTGDTGFYNNTYSRGIYVKDTTWVRTYPDGSAFACGTLNCNDITTNNNAIAMGNGTINFNNNGAGLNWGNYSQIFDNGDLYIKTDDNMRFFSDNVEKMVLNSGGLYISGSTIATLLIPNSGGGIVGGRLNDTFTYSSNTVNNYGLKWNNDSENTGGFTGYLSGWGGLKFFTYGNLKMYIQGYNGSVVIPGSMSKGSGTFDIEHPLDSNSRLLHSFIEGPRCDLIYRGSVQLINGTATVNIDSDSVCKPESAMRQGTFEALVANPDIFLQNKTSFDQIIGNISGNILTIISNNTTSNALVSWMVIGERKDPFIKNWDRTNADGYLITEYSSTSTPLE